MVFDLGSHRLLSSWKPQFQTSRSPHIEDWPYRSALSALGEYVAESGDGSLVLYHIVP